MESDVGIFLKLYAPLLMSAGTLVSVFLVGKGTGTTRLRWKPLRFIDAEIPISNQNLIRAVLLLSTVLMMLPYLFYDYSTIFPRHVSMEVFYDEAGLRNSLCDFSEQELVDLRIMDNFADERKQYVAELDHEVESILGTKQFFCSVDGAVHSSGSTSFIVKKLGGWQRYHVEESSGRLAHILDTPGEPQKTFYTLFEKLPTPCDYLRPSPSQMFFNRCVVLSPRFKQILATDKTNDGVLFRVSVIGLTKITIFPWPSISNTVYLADLGPKGLVPVAYAVY